MNILALDCGTNTGWASEVDGRIESGVQDFSLKRGESKGIRFLRFNTWLKIMLELTKPHIVVYEMAHLRGGHATEILVGMTTRIEEFCESKNIEWLLANPDKRKKNYRRFIVNWLTRTQDKGGSEKIRRHPAGRP
ncbi:unnamed protein product, partial [marine sediment metagenome]